MQRRQQQLTTTTTTTTAATNSSPRKMKNFSKKQQRPATATTAHSSPPANPPRRPTTKSAAGKGEGWSPEAYPSDNSVGEESLQAQPLQQPLQPLQSTQAGTHNPYQEVPTSMSMPQHSCVPQQQASQPSPKVICYGCCIKPVIMGTACCSRRCTWLTSHCCPQCGKKKPEGYTYCSRTCSYQSTQANWCSSCGVCQTDLSGFCQNLDCIGATTAAAASHRSNSTGSSNTTPPPEAASSIRGGSGFAAGSGPMFVPHMGSLMMQQQAPTTTLPYFPTMTLPNQQQMGPAQPIGAGYCLPQSYPQYNQSHQHLGGMNSGTPGGRRMSTKMESRVLTSSEMNASGIPTVFSQLWSAGLATRLVGGVKLTAGAAHRKRYLSHRSLVENQMASQGLSKYGHGGEGNEQRRYLGCPLLCNLGYDASQQQQPTTTTPPEAPSAIGGGAQGRPQLQRSCKAELGEYVLPNLRACHNSNCVACCVLTKGFDLAALGVGSHYCNTTSTPATQFLQPCPSSGLKAMVIARVVVGNPEVHFVDATTEPPFIQSPSNPAFNHSLILTNNDTSLDGTYVFADESVDPQYLVFFE